MQENSAIVKDFENFLQNHLPSVQSFHPHFDTALKEMLLAGGKRFRPLLLLLVTKHYAPLLLPNAMHVALCVELLHTYSLIHDDLPCMDDADLRRGKTTLHVKYDEVTAVLVGDALNTQAFGFLADAPLSSDIKVRLISTLARNGGIDGMIIGQAIDCHFEGQKLTLAELEYLHINKTAKLIAASLQMGAIIAGASASDEQSLYDFGLQLGLLFQIQDDIIDATVSSVQAGKTTCNDGEKNSFVNLLGIDGAQKQKQTLVGKLEAELAKLDDSLAQQLQQIIKDYF